jgi:lipoate-protein ligase A
MGIDEAILNAVGTGHQPPTLRLYRWTTPCLSIGYGQRIRDVDAERLAARGWELVRRPTAGRAVLHAAELTYSLCLPMTHPLASGGVVESCRRISAGLLAALREWGVDAAAHAAESAAVINPVCFETPSHYEITVGGRKLVGSAQLRREKALLQHGSLPLTGDLARICDVLAYTTEGERDAAKAALRQRALTLVEAVGRVVVWGECAHAVLKGFSETFVLEYNQDRLSDTEQTDAARLADDKYAAAAWNHKR